MKKRIPISIRRLLMGGRVLTVACVNSDEDAEYMRNNPHCAHIVEWRIDKTCSVTVIQIMEWLKGIGKPIILTPRSRYEGGARSDWTFTDRKWAFRMYMHLAAILDIEVNDAAFFTDIIGEARALGLVIVFSYHSLDGFPEEKEILFAFQNFKAFGRKGDIFKIALNVKTARQLGVCTRLVARFNEEAPGCIAAMATGKKGKRVRMDYALKGLTMMVYCFLRGSIVSGQYQVEEFRHEFERLAA